MEKTDNLSLPYIMPSQAQKHVTHNEAIRLLDCIIQLSVKTQTLTSPPLTPIDGERHIIAAGATGQWLSRDTQIAAWQDGAWAFYIPAAGWLAWVEDQAALFVFTAGIWDLVSSNAESVAQLGINAVADATNRLSLSAPASLFNHEGAGHQIKVNKNVAGDTASLLYQTGFTGHAEMGLAGNNDFSIKVSPDGAAWNNSIFVDAATGFVGLAGNVTPVLALEINGSVKAEKSDINAGFIAYRTSGKSCAVGAGLGACYFMFDNTGTFAVSSQTSASVLTGTAAGKTDLLVVTPGASGNIKCNLPLKLQVTTVAGLLAAATAGAGATAYVTDALTTPTYNGIATAGGSTKVGVRSDGTNWRYC